MTELDKFIEELGLTEEIADLDDEIDWSEVHDFTWEDDDE